MKLSIDIEQVQNGYIAKFVSENSNEEPRKKTLVLLRSEDVQVAVKQELARNIIDNF
jgi:hypothetical protein